MIDVGELMTDPDFVQPFRIQRAGRGVRGADGIYVRGPYDELAAEGSIQPVGPADMKALPEGTKIDEVISIWTASELTMADESGAESDLVIYDCKRWRVIRIEPRAEHGYFRVFAEGLPPS